jgi:hypothetical protein
MSKFLDKELYFKAKRIADNTYEKHSAYKSMFLVNTYKKLGGKIDDSIKNKSGTEKWNNEKWKNLTPYALGNIKSIKKTPACGYRGKNQKDNPSICRPTIKIDKTTPKLAQDYTKSQIKKALKIKKTGKNITWDKL